MFSPGKYEQKDGLPRAWNIFFPLPVWLLRGSGASLGNKRSRQRGEKDGGRRLKQGGRVEGCAVAFCICAPVSCAATTSAFIWARCDGARILLTNPPTVASVLNALHLRAATYFFTAFSPYTSLSVILLVVLCRRHFWFGLRSFILRSFVLFSPTISRGSVSFFFFSFFCARPFAWLLKQCALGRISLCRKRMLPCSLSQYERGSLVRCWLISLALRGRHCVRYLLHSVARCLCCPGRVYISFVCGQRSRRLCPLWRAVSKNV